MSRWRPYSREFVPHPTGPTGPLLLVECANAPLVVHLTTLLLLYYLSNYLSNASDPNLVVCFNFLCIVPLHLPSVFFHIVLLNAILHIQTTLFLHVDPASARIPVDFLEMRFHLPHFPSQPASCTLTLLACSLSVSWSFKL